MQTLSAILIFYFGAIIGSFLNMLIWRLPRGKSLGGRSVCPHCGHTLHPIDLIPMISFLLLGGKCRYCRKRIAVRYLFAELVCALLFCGTFLLLLPADAAAFLQLAKDGFVIAVLVLVFVIDLEHYVILDIVVLPAAGILLGLGLVQSAFFTHSFSAVAADLIGMAAAPLPFFIVWLVSKGAWMGFGDVKFMIFAGAALGWPTVGIALLLSVFIGSIVGIGLIISGRKNLQSRVPFGTFLSIGTLIALFYGPFLLHWYLFALGF